jgi:hypothetical protein
MSYDLCTASRPCRVPAPLQLGLLRNHKVHYFPLNLISVLFSILYGENWPKHIEPMEVS